MSNPLISIITVTFNAATVIEQTILSVLNQTYKNIEYIIKDGESKDSTLDIINKYKNDIDCIKVCPDKGIFDAMNQAIQIANGNWIIFMNAGDIFYSKEVISKIFEEEIDSNVGFIWGYTQYLQKDKLKTDYPIPFYENSKFIKPMGFCHQSVFIRRELALKYPYDLDYKVTADFKMIKNIYDNNFLPQKKDIIISQIDLNGFSAHNRILQYREIGKLWKIDNTLKFKIFILLKTLKKNIYDTL